MSASTEPKKRRAWLAALLSLLLPGLGQLYTRNTRSALRLMVAAFLVPLPGLWLLATLPASTARFGLALLIVVAVGLTLYAIVQATIEAIRVRKVPLAWFNRWYIYVGWIVMLSVWQNVGPLLPIPRLAGYSMPSASMLPTAVIGDYFAARSRAFADRAPERGELAIFRVPHEPEVDFIKRVVGLGGDRIQVRDGRLYLNNTLVERNPIDDSMIAALPEDFENGHIYRETLPDGASYLIVERGDDTWLDDTPEFVVPADTVFVLGDNRDSSIDSRTKLGFVPITGLRDKPLFVFWSVDLSRIGRVFE